MITWLATMPLIAVAFGYAHLERKGLRKHLAHCYATNSRLFDTRQGRLITVQFLCHILTLSSGTTEMNDHLTM